MQALSEKLGRRGFLIIAGGVAAACGSSPALPVKTPPGPTPDKKPCHTPATGPGLNYCLVTSDELRVPDAALLAVGQVRLFSVDDSTAALVARDAQGFYALSAICTHACCLVAVCGDAACHSPEPNPGACNSTRAATLVTSGSAFLCSCHGSGFAADGSVINGPAIRPLPSVKMRFDGQDVLVDLSTPELASQRLMPV
jgi:Rieske Fe-S protein